MLRVGSMTTERAFEKLSSVVGSLKDVDQLELSGKPSGTFF